MLERQREKRRWSVIEVFDPGHAAVQSFVVWIATVVACFIKVAAQASSLGPNSIEE